MVCLLEMLINGHFWGMFMRNAPISEKKLKCITEYDGFGGKYLDIDVCLSLFTEMGPFI